MANEKLKKTHINLHMCVFLCTFAPKTQNLYLS